MLGTNRYCPCISEIASPILFASWTDAHTLSKVATCVRVLYLPIHLFLILPFSMMKISLQAIFTCVGVSQPYHVPV